MIRCSSNDLWKIWGTHFGQQLKISASHWGKTHNHIAFSASFSLFCHELNWPWGVWHEYIPSGHLTAMDNGTSMDDLPISLPLKNGDFPGNHRLRGTLFGCCHSRLPAPRRGPARCVWKSGGTPPKSHGIYPSCLSYHTRSSQIISHHICRVLAHHTCHVPFIISSW